MKNDIDKYNRQITIFCIQMNFSERYKYKNIPDIQMESMDGLLRNGLWNMLAVHSWNKVQPDIVCRYKLSNPLNQEIRDLCFQLFEEYGIRIELEWDDWVAVRKLIETRFSHFKWNKVYDFMEFVAKHHKGDTKDFFAGCNRVLERHNAAYRFIGGIITRITEQQEVEEIELALDSACQVSTHLRQSIEMLFNREKPDYRNSIKESISAIESLVCIIVGEKGTLGDLIRKLEDEIGLHKTLIQAFSKLYGYTSDADGIRHALWEPENVKFEDAKFFLVVCSAFINYVKAKTGVNC